jgi:hypothetical protein
MLISPQRTAAWLSNLAHTGESSRRPQAVQRTRISRGFRYVFAPPDSLLSPGGVCAIIPRGPTLSERIKATEKGSTGFGFLSIRTAI